MNGTPERRRSGQLRPPLLMNTLIEVAILDLAGRVLLKYLPNPPVNPSSKEKGPGGQRAGRQSGLSSESHCFRPAALALLRVLADGSRCCHLPRGPGCLRTVLRDG